MNHKARIKRRTILKNVVFKIILHVREKLKRPKLLELMQILKDSGGGEIIKKQLLSHLLNTYSSKKKKHVVVVDTKYQQINLSLDRVVKSLQVQHDTLDVIDKKIQNLTK